jgi:hypothetical protein
MCHLDFYLQYNAGWRQPSNKKADRGNIIHKGLEILARKKLALQRGETTFREEEMFGGTNISVEVSPDQAINMAWESYTKDVCPQHGWTEADKKDIAHQVWRVLLFNDGMFSPLTRNIIAPEQFFDLTIDEPWADYDYTFDDGTRLSWQTCD